MLLGIILKKHASLCNKFNIRMNNFIFTGELKRATLFEKVIRFLSKTDAHATANIIALSQESPSTVVLTILSESGSAFLK